MNLRLLTLLTLALSATAACKQRVVLYCDEDTPCESAERPYCDINGDYPASEGIGNTCIPDPFGVDGGLASADAGNEAPDGSTEITVTNLFVGEGSTCALLSNQKIRCWGNNHGHPEFSGNIGDDELPFVAGDVDVGGDVKEVSVGQIFACALLVNGDVRCWGQNVQGVLGDPSAPDYVGDDETPAEQPVIELSGKAVHIASGSRHTCVVLESGDVQCWGDNSSGELGLGHKNDVGDNETPKQAGVVNLGGKATDVSAGPSHTCALLDTGHVRCWGRSYDGELGYGSLDNVGDNEAVSTYGDVDAGATFQQVEIGNVQTCGLTDGGDVRCWGRGPDLGYGSTENVGDNEAPSTAGTVSLGGKVSQIAALGATNCALLMGGSVRCWGSNLYGELGLALGSTEKIGDDELPSSVDPVMLGGSVRRLARGGSSQHPCVLLESGAVRCWGYNNAGQLGLGNTENVGDNELPTDVQPVRIFE